MPHFFSSSSSTSDREADGPVFIEIPVPAGNVPTQRIPALPPAMTALSLKNCHSSYRNFSGLKILLIEMMCTLLFHEETVSFLAPTAALTGVTPGFLLERLFVLHDPTGCLLRDFEDLYYALLAKVKDLHEQIRLRVENGFLSLDTVLHSGGAWAPQYCGPEIAGPFPVWEFVALLEFFWGDLNDPKYIKPLDDMVKMKKPAREPHRGLEMLGDWAPGMIAAFLNEKFGVEV